MELNNKVASEKGAHTDIDLKPELTNATADSDETATPAGETIKAPHRNRRRTIGIALICVFSTGILFAILLAFLVVPLTLQPVKIEGVGMSPTLNRGDRVFIRRSLGKIKRGDIVTFWNPRKPNEALIKRVVGLPGEIIEIRDGKVLINGAYLDEPYLKFDLNKGRSEFPTTKVPAESYFVIGDNRNASYDSRAWGPLPARLIYGKVQVRYWTVHD